MRAKGELLLAHAPIITLGCTLISTLSLMTLAIATVSSTRSQTNLQVNPTLAESISGLNESLEMESAVFRLKVTGRSTMEAAQSLRTMFELMERNASQEQSYQPTVPQGA